jgi:hypothetical protein
MKRLAALVERALNEAEAVRLAQEDFADKAKPLTMKSLIVFPKNGWASPVVGRDWVSPAMEGTPSAAFCENFAFVVVAREEEGRKLLDVGSARKPSCGDYMAALDRDSSLRLRIERESASPDQPMGAMGGFRQAVASNVPSKGIFVREPELARLLIEVKDPKSSTGWKHALRDEPRWMPQIGRLRFLPFESGPFENESLTLSLRKDGRVESAAYETKDAALARIASGAADATEKYIAMTEKREAAARADQKYAFELAGLQRADEKAQLEQEIAIREGNVKRLRAAETEAAVTAEVAAQEIQEKAELEILRREKETLDLQEAIRKLRNPPPA